MILHGKCGKVRRVEIPRNCANILTEYLKKRGLEKQYQRHVFSSQTHEHMTVSCVEGIYAKYVTAAKQQHPELFRQKSYPPHSMTTQIYAQISPNTVDKHLKAWTAAKLTSCNSPFF